MPGSTKISLSAICPCNSNQVSGELWGKPISTSLECDEIDYPQAEQKKEDRVTGVGAAPHLCVCPCPDNCLFVLAIDSVFYHTKKVFYGASERETECICFQGNLSCEAYRLCLRSRPYTRGGPLYSNTPPPQLPCPIQKLMQQCEMIVDVRY